MFNFLDTLSSNSFSPTNQVFSFSFSPNPVKFFFRNQNLLIYRYVIPFFSPFIIFLHTLRIIYLLIFFLLLYFFHYVSKIFRLYFLLFFFFSFPSKPYEFSFFFRYFNRRKNEICKNSKRKRK